MTARHEQSREAAVAAARVHQQAKCAGKIAQLEAALAASAEALRTAHEAGALPSLHTSFRMLKTHQLFIPNPMGFLLLLETRLRFV